MSFETTSPQAYNQSMKLISVDRVEYNPNPLVEVVAQLRFPKSLQIQNQLPFEFQNRIADQYPILEVQNEAVSFMVGSPVNTSQEDLPTNSIYHFLSTDKVWKISLSSDFVAISCTKYKDWESFKPKFIEGIGLIAEIYKIKFWTRLGLRYRDLIVREDIGISKMPWRDLISPHLLGFALADNIVKSSKIPEKDVLEQQGFINLDLDNCKLSLRHGLIKRHDKLNATGYLIDSDFYVDKNEPEELKNNEISKLLDKFHANARTIFRSCITSELHKALNPKKIT